MRIKNINKTDIIKINDTATKIRLCILDFDNKPFDLTTAMKVIVVIGTSKGRLLTKVSEVLDETGVIEFGLDEGDSLVEGDNLIEVHVIMPNGEKHVAPSNGYYKLKLQRSIDSLGEKVTTVTLDYFLEEANRALDEMNTKVEYVNQTANDLRLEVATAIQHVDDTAEDLLQEVGENLDSLVTQEVDNKMTPFVEVVNERLAQKANRDDLEIESARINSLIAHAGDTDGNAELLDIRVGFDGITYATAGEATRAISNYMINENEFWEV